MPETRTIGARRRFARPAMLSLLLAALLLPAVGAQAFRGQHVWVSARCMGGADRPSQIILACGDASAYLASMRWSSWGGQTARGHGKIHVNACQPNCAAGHFVVTGVTVRLSVIRRCGSQLFYTHVKVSGGSPDYVVEPPYRCGKRLG